MQYASLRLAYSRVVVVVYIEEVVRGTQTNEPVSGQDPDVYCMMQSVDLRLPVSEQPSFALPARVSLAHHHVSTTQYSLIKEMHPKGLNSWTILESCAMNGWNK